MSPRTSESPLFPSSTQASSSPQDLLQQLQYPQLCRLQTPAQETQYWRDVNKGLRLKTKITVLKLLKEDMAKPRKERRTNAQLAEIAGCGTTLVKKVKRLFKKNPNLNYKDLAEVRRGPLPNFHTKIPFEVYEHLCDALTTVPSTYGLDQSSWTAAAVKDFFEIFEICVNLDFVYRYLNRMGFTSKVGKRVNPKRNPQAVREFTENEYAQIVEEAKELGEMVIFSDETSVQQGESNRGFAKRNVRSMVSYNQCNRHTGMSLLIFMGPGGFLEIFEVENAMDADTFIKCLKDLKKAYPGQKFVIVLDNCRVHHAKKVDKWLKRKNGGGGCFRFKFLPAYAPELNPVERLNNVLKNEIKKTECRSSKDVVDVAERALNKFINKASMDKSTVTNLFLDKDCSYSKIVHDKIMGDLPQKATNVA